MRYLWTLSILLVLLAAACAWFPKTFPSDWPIPELTLPPTAALRKNVIKMDLMGGNGTTWIAPIRFECTASELIEHVESCLKPLGYMRMAVGSQKRDIKSEIQVELYYSPDWKTKVTVDTLSNQLSVDLSQVVFMEMKLYQMSKHIKLEEL